MRLKTTKECFEEKHLFIDEYGEVVKEFKE